MAFPNDYRTIGRSLYEELLDLLDQGEHIALLGPRQGGKTIVLEELQKYAQQRSLVDKPLIADIFWKDFNHASDEIFLNDLAKQLVVEIDWNAVQSATLSGQLEHLFRSAFIQKHRSIWVFVRDILGFPSHIARELLVALQACYHDPQLRNHSAAVVTGSADFVHLTYENLSPYHHAKKFVIKGLDYQTSEAFFCSRRRCQRGDNIHELKNGTGGIDSQNEIEPDAFSFLYEQTGGNAHLIQEMVLSLPRHPYDLKYLPISRKWTLKQTKKCVARFVELCLPSDFVCRTVVREIEQNPEAFDLLLAILGKAKLRTAFPDDRPHLLEVSGVAFRKETGSAYISCPIWNRFLELFLTDRHIADVYAWQHRWTQAWEASENIPLAQRDRAVSGDAVFRLRTVIMDWENSLMDQAPEGPNAVWEHFFKGMQHFLGFDAGGLYDAEVSPIRLLGPESVFGDQDFYKPDTSIEPTQISTGPGYHRAYWLDSTRHTVHSDPAFKLRQPPGVRPILLLHRKGYGRVIDSAEQQKLKRILDRFWQAYETAHDLYYRRIIGDLREKHLQVIMEINRIVSTTPFDMGNVIQGAAECLVSIAGYRRILICLVNPKRERIQAVAGSFEKQEDSFNYKTDYPLNNPGKPIEEWDIQPWVVQKGLTCVVPDASSSTQRNPTTNWCHVEKIGMRAISVVPIKFNNVVLGTIHFERKDKSVPSKAEQNLCEMLADQLGTIIQQAQRFLTLQQSVLFLKDEIRFVNPLKQIVFINKAAKRRYGDKELGWQVEPFEHKCILTKGEKCLVDQVDEANEPLHHYETSDTPPIASDWLVAPIDDFRSRLDPPYSSDGRIGFIEQIHDLTPLYRYLQAFHNWLSAQGSFATASDILRFFETLHYNWARIYLIRLSDNGTEYLESFAEFGLKKEENRIRFRNGLVRFPANAPDRMPWHVLREEPYLLIHKFDASLPKGTIIKVPSEQGLPCFATGEFQYPKELEKVDKQWLEAPLLVGKRFIGKLCLALPSDLRPDIWEELRIAISGIGAALDEALRTEQEATKGIEEAWKSAAQQAVHQLTNKIVPHESNLHIAKDILTTKPEQVRELISRAEEGLRSARAILQDFQKYASDKPFPDRRVMSILELLEEMKLAIERGYTELGVVSVTTSIPEELVEASLDAFREISCTLASDSIRHNKASVDVSLSAEISEPPPGLQTCVNKFIRIVYRDTGVGITDELRAKIFTPFFTTHPQGTGLGTVIARRYLHRHGGEMTEEGKADEGICFCLYLPTKNEDENYD